MHNGISRQRCLVTALGALKTAIAIDGITMLVTTDRAYKADGSCSGAGRKWRWENMLQRLDVSEMQSPHIQRNAVRHWNAATGSWRITKGHTNMPANAERCKLQFIWNNPQLSGEDSWGHPRGYQKEER